MVSSSSVLDWGENAVGKGKGGVRLGTGETVSLSSKFWDIYNESTSRFIVDETRPVDYVCAIRARTTITKVPRHAGK